MTKIKSIDDHQGWDTKYRDQTDGPAWSEKPQPRVEDFLAELPVASHVADLGAGDGRNSIIAASLGHRVTMVDFSRTALSLALELAAERGVQAPVAVEGSIENLPLAGSQFDAVICMDTLPQLKNLERGVNEIHRVLKPGGHCLVNVFSKLDCAFGEGERVSPSSYVYKNCYFSFFEKDDLPELCEGRLEVVDFEQIGWDDPPHVPFRPYPHRHDAFFFVLKKR